MAIDPRELLKKSPNAPPPEIVRVIGPPKALAEKLKDLERTTVCGGRDEFVWGSGQEKNLAVSGYCAEPLCIDTGECTGPRWVPNLQQYTLIDLESEYAKPRRMSPKEVLRAINEFTRRARKRGARPDDRTDEVKVKFAGDVWRRTIKAIRGDGDWTPT